MMIPNGGGNVEGNIDLFLFDFILEFGETRTWAPTIRTSETDPVWFAREWAPTRHTNNAGPFVNRNTNDMIFREEHIPDLAALRPVAAYNVDRIAIAPRDAQEEAAQHFYGDYIGEFDVLNMSDDLLNVGEPISTNRWDEAMSQLYAGARKPPIPRTYTYPQQPQDPPNDDNRAALWVDYGIFVNEVRIFWSAISSLCSSLILLLAFCF